MRKAAAGTPNTMVSLRLPTSLLDALSARCKATGKTFSGTVRELLASGLSEWRSTESETRALRDEVRALRDEVRAALDRRNTR
jgi:hypothetical protein